MITTYFRSSSFNEWGLCQQQYFLDYILGIPQASGKKAEMGTIFHKVMECLANANLARKRKDSAFVDPQLGPIPVDDSTLHTPAFLDRIFNLAYNHYTYPGRTKHHFYPADKKAIYGWTNRTVDSSGGLFDPRKRDVVAAEPHFDFEISEPWAAYEFENPNGGEPIKGQLHIKGTIDLVTRVSEDTFEVIDWKTGQRKDWATDTEKDFDKLSIDPQLRMYHYAVHRLYPDVKHVVMSINFVRPDQGGPFTMAYGPEDIAATLAMLRERFTKIKATVRPQLKSSGSAHWFCTKVCHYGRNPHPKDPGQCICQYIKKKTLREGLNAVIRTETYENHKVDNYDNPGE